MEWIKRLLGYDKLEEENVRLTDELLTLHKSYELTSGANRELCLRILKLEDELELLKSDPEQYIEREIEKRSLTMEEEIEDKIKHKWYAIGRIDAYAQDGCTIIDMRENGEVPVVTVDGENVELLKGLVDVKADVGKMTIPDDEIVIDDLVEV